MLLILVAQQNKKKKNYFEIKIQIFLTNNSRVSSMANQNLFELLSIRFLMQCKYNN